ncbi:DNA-3-methyladenine glycosylase [Actinomadura harenae]|uniref:Putative 3-methyladenine DNA glycosylase n=1 Tax=Actinomadura harenae TaxID=2483351 RepID=A0A3M2LIM1_9ACTN|nr:DNA-3-methyladenine glycosylase [Actinomadura harenae]RMI36640.1 DNA-3-methyladenine glycosylase [Actinomadura harenae]
MDGTPLPRTFYDAPVEFVAPRLLGSVLVHTTVEGTVAVRLTEVEAYAGPRDPASHAYRGQTGRNAVMFGPPGHTYVYFTYGMHHCVNLVCGPAGTASGILLRAGEIIAGHDLAAARRPGASARDLARGPARLCKALAIARPENGLDVCDPDGPLRVLRGDPLVPTAVRSGPRVGVNGGKDTPWRFWIDGDPTVSAYRPHVPKRRPSTRP